MGIAPAVFPQVEDEGVSVGEEIHRGHNRGPADLRVSKEIELQITNVAFENLRLIEAGRLENTWVLSVGMIARVQQRPGMELALCSWRIRVPVDGWEG